MNPATVAPVELFTVPGGYLDSAVCPCGNDTFGEGFESCLADGQTVEPIDANGWTGHFVCTTCGRIGNGAALAPGDETLPVSAILGSQQIVIDPETHEHYTVSTAFGRRQHIWSTRDECAVCGTGRELR